GGGASLEFFSGAGAIRGSVTGCTFDGNSALVGGAIEGFEQATKVTASATLTLTNSTLFANSASLGGGLDNSANGSGIVGVTLLSDTVAFNSANQGGGLQGNGISVRSTIVADNVAATGPDVSGTFTSLGHNLIGQTDGSSGWIGTDLTGTSASPLDP